MDLPKGRGVPKLPPKPRGGGAAARQEQFELERGLGDDRPQGDVDKEAQKDVDEKNQDGRKKGR